MFFLPVAKSLLDIRGLNDIINAGYLFQRLLTGHSLMPAYDKKWLVSIN